VMLVFITSAIEAGGILSRKTPLPLGEGCADLQTCLLGVAG
jgi:hypothetical protein